LLSDDTGDWFLWSGGISLLVAAASKVNGVPVRIYSIINILVGMMILFSGVIGLWGLFAISGQQEFNGMAAIIPFYSLLASLIRLILLAILNLIWSVKRRRS
jgi:hypothetical protein